MHFIFHSLTLVLVLLLSSIASSADRKSCTGIATKGRSAKEKIDKVASANQAISHLEKAISKFRTLSKSRTIGFQPFYGETAPKLLSWERAPYAQADRLFETTRRIVSDANDNLRLLNLSSSHLTQEKIEALHQIALQLSNLRYSWENHNMTGRRIHHVSETLLEQLKAELNSAGTLISSLK